eukprot:s2490_g2.t1
MTCEESFLAPNIVAAGKPIVFGFMDENRKPPRSSFTVGWITANYPTLYPIRAAMFSAVAGCGFQRLQSRSPLGGCATVVRRWLRERARPSRAREKVFTVDSPAGKQWPPMDQVGNPMTPQRCRDLMHQLHLQEVEKMKQQRSFTMPTVRPGDLVEVKYELSRSQQTFAVFQGYCVTVRNKYLNSGFVLKNTYDGVGVEQLVPKYSPRLMGVRVIQPLQPRAPNIDKRPWTRSYRYCWHYFVRGKYSWGKRLRWKFHTPQLPGIMSLEPKIRRELANVRRRYQMQRAEAMGEWADGWGGWG